MIAIYGKTLEAYYIARLLDSIGETVYICHQPVSKTELPIPVVLTEEWRRLFPDVAVPMAVSDELFFSYLLDDGTLYNPGTAVELADAYPLYDMLRSSVGQNTQVICGDQISFDLQKQIIQVDTTSVPWDRLILTEIPVSEFFVESLCAHLLDADLAVKPFRKDKDPLSMEILLGLSPNIIAGRIAIQDLAKQYTYYWIRGFQQIDTKISKQAYQCFRSKAKPLQSWYTCSAFGSLHQAALFHHNFPSVICVGLAAGICNPLFLCDGFDIHRQALAVIRNDIHLLRASKWLALLNSNQYTAKFATTSLVKSFISQIILSAYTGVPKEE